jgi:nucleoside-diphosphate-sugar epimerase
MTIEQFTKSSRPVTVIINIANPVAIKLAKILLEQGSRLLIIDKITQAKRQLLGDLLVRADCLFVDAESIFKNIEKFKKIDYVYYFLSQLSSGSTYPEIFPENMEIQKVSHKDFIRESNRLDAYLKLSSSFDAVFTMITSGYVSQLLEALPEANAQLQRYAESLVTEYVERNNVNARIARVGELIGRDADLASPTYVARLVREVILRRKINVFGDGMQQNFLVHTEDAVYAILKAAFSPEAKGRTYLVAYPHPFTSLSVAYQLLELTSEEREVVFNEVLPQHDHVSKLRDMCLAPAASALGWEPQVRLDQALAETVSVLAHQLDRPWKQVGVDKIDDEESAAAKEHSTKETRNAGKTTIVSGAEGIKYSAYQQLVANPLLRLLSITKPTTRVTTPAQKQQKTKKILGIIVALLVTILVTPYIHFAITSYRVYALAKQIRSDLTALDSSRFPDYAKQMPKLVDGLVRDYRAVWYLKSIPKIGDWYIASGDLVYGGQSMATSAAVVLDTADPVLTIAQGLAAVNANEVIPTTRQDYQPQIAHIISKETSIIQANQDAKIGNTRLQRLDVAAFPAAMQAMLYKLKGYSLQYATTIDELARVYDLIPYLLGYKDKRTYFIMVQNETEIRATGGWFTSYAVLNVENGQIEKLQVNDVYNFDGSITGVPAPLDMQRALGVKTMKLSLSNWDPAMDVTSKQITQLLSQSGKSNQNDVTIAMTFQVVKEILAVVGGVQVDGLGEVNANNLYDRVGQLHSDFVPGSQEKTSVLSTFLPGLVDKIAAAPLAQKQAVMQVLAKAIAQHSIMIYSDNTEIRTRVLDYFSTYRTVRAKDNPLFVVDWNWGGNKANRYIKRSMDVLLDEESHKATLTLLYTNDSKTDGYPEGTYVNMQRIYYPKEFTYLMSSGFTKVPSLYRTADGVPYLLAEGRVKKQETKSFFVEFSLSSVPATLNLYKQSGFDVEVARVMIKRAASSAVTEKQLQDYGFTQDNGVWVKTYVRKEDVSIRLTGQ